MSLYHQNRVINKIENVADVDFEQTVLQIPYFLAFCQNYCKQTMFFGYWPTIDYGRGSQMSKPMQGQLTMRLYL